MNSEPKEWPKTALDWARSFEWFPSIQPERCFASQSEKRRLLEQSAVTVNGFKIKPNDPWPDRIWELVFFKGAKRQTTIGTGQKGPDEG